VSSGSGFVLASGVVMVCLFVNEIGNYLQRLLTLSDVKHAEMALTGWQPHSGR
jgi:hypothetical protein